MAVTVFSPAKAVPTLLWNLFRFFGSRCCVEYFLVLRLFFGDNVLSFRVEQLDFLERVAHHVKHQDHHQDNHQLSGKNCFKRMSTRSEIELFLLLSRR
eukprot:Seg247.1 transcript_id=Seg247.1/GoldUCD/mRNA.D3Y31 product="hypothetical protein" protein_id=Seg247.1/GoldUCD/D3Y31